MTIFFKMRHDRRAIQQLVAAITRGVPPQVGCALAAQEMGGSLTVYSAGAGQGATFILDIPVDAQQNRG